MHLYETHLHTYPVSNCAKAGVRENLEFYKKLGYAGIFITNHFLDGNINIDSSLSYEEKIHFCFSDYEKALELGKEIGISVFYGVELSLCVTDFLVYGLDKRWFLAHPEIMNMEKCEQLLFFMENQALVIQAHPYRTSFYDHIRLFPRQVHGVEIINACRSDFENNMAEHYAESYGLLKFAGTDNHIGNKQISLAGMCSSSPISDEKEFVRAIKNREMSIFTKVIENDTYTISK